MKTTSRLQGLMSHRRRAFVLAAHCAGVRGRRAAAVPARHVHSPPLALVAVALVVVVHGMGSGTADVFPHLLRPDAPVIVCVVAEPRCDGAGQCAVQLDSALLALCCAVCRAGRCRCAVAESQWCRRRATTQRVAQGDSGGDRAACGSRCGGLYGLLAQVGERARVSQRQLHPRQDVARILSGRQRPDRLSRL